MSNDAGAERQAYRGERLAIVMRYVRSGQAISKWDAELLVSEIDRLRDEVQRREEDLLHAARYQTPHDCEPLREENVRLRKSCTQYAGRVHLLVAKAERLERELGMVRAARNVALDKLVQIARIVGRDDAEEEA